MIEIAHKSVKSNEMSNYTFTSSQQSFKGKVR